MSFLPSNDMEELNSNPEVQKQFVQIPKAFYKYGIAKEQACKYEYF